MWAKKWGLMSRTLRVRAVGLGIPVRDRLKRSLCHLQLYVLVVIDSFVATRTPVGRFMASQPR